MLNILSLLGPSRCGKGAIIPIIAAVKNFELPFNTPDLDWYVDAYNCGDINSDALCRLSSNYLLCYAWYGHLGRHINLRPDDYYSLQRMMPHIDLAEKHDRKDKDNEFIEFIKGNDASKFWNIFQWDLSPEIYEIYQEKYPINTNPLYCYRSPYYLFTSWISSNRVERSLSLSRMFKYDATHLFKRAPLFSQFEGARNDNEVSFIKEIGTYKYKEFKFDDVRVKEKEEARLIDLLKDSRANASYWKDKGMMFRFEHIVSDPNGFVQYLKDRFNVKFDEKLLAEGITLMDKRPLKEIVEFNFDHIDATLTNLGCSKETVEFVMNEQHFYLSTL